MKLVESYSTLTSLSIDDKPFIVEKFYPLPHDRYITIQGGAGFASKCYGFYQDVIDLLTPFLSKANIKIVLLGGKTDKLYQGVFDARGNTLGQSHYLIRAALLHFGNDSWMTHAAGWLNKPLVALYGPTSKDIHGPYWSNKESTVLLSSHRWGRNPTFAAQENPMSIALIDPYDVARAVLDLLAIPHTLTQRTVHIGPSYNAQLLEWLPNTPVNPAFNPEASLVARFDLCANEAALVQTLQSGRKVNLLTKTPLPLGLLQGFKPLILSYGHEMDEATPLDYVAAVKKLFPAATFFTRDPDLEKLAALRFKFFDVTTIQHVTDKTRADFIKAAQEYTNDPTFSLDTADKSRKMEFKTNKMILSNGKVYLSHAHEKADIPVGAEGAHAARDEDVWYHDANHWMVYQS
jgi:hypothetical protein